MGGILGRRVWEQMNGGLWLPNVHHIQKNGCAKNCCPGEPPPCNFCGCSNPPDAEDLRFTFYEIPDWEFGFGGNNDILPETPYQIGIPSNKAGCSYSVQMNYSPPIYYLVSMTMCMTSWGSQLYPNESIGEAGGALTGTSLCVFFYRYEGLYIYWHILRNDPVSHSGDCSEFLDGYVVGDYYWTDDPDVNVEGASVEISIV